MRKSRDFLGNENKSRLIKMLKNTGIRDPENETLILMQL